MAGRGVIELTDIELPYIERNTSRHGRTRYYLRIDGRRLGRLPDDPGSAPRIMPSVRSTEALPVAAGRRRGARFIRECPPRSR